MKGVILAEFLPVANGISTDHPAPSLPFVDDTHLPVDDPDGIEALGRHEQTDMWGRCDRDRSTGEWIAFTTDPKNHDYAWVVQHHPAHGRSVLLYRDSAASNVHATWLDRPRALLSRAGGYWWDGIEWYRPRQILDWAQEGYAARSVRHPETITADDVLDDSCKPAFGKIHKVAPFQPRAVDDEQWRHDLALWASRRRAHESGRPSLKACVVTLNAPELVDNKLLSIDEFAERAGIAASTLRAYISRDEADVPLPQSTAGGRKRWSVPVVDDWLEERRRDPHEVGAILTGEQDGGLAPALRDSWQRMTESIRSILDRRRRRGFRRGSDHDSLAAQAGWVAALTADQDRLHGEALAKAVEKSVLWELYTSAKFYAQDPGARDSHGMAIGIGAMLGWFIRTDPGMAPQVFGSIIREAETKLEIPPHVTGNSLRDAIWFDGGLPEEEKERLKKFFKAALPPSASSAR